MKYFLLTFILFFTHFGYAQIGKGKKFADKGDFKTAIEAFENDLEKESTKPIALYEISKILFNPKYEDYNTENAYKYVDRALKEYASLNQSNRKKVQGKGLSKLSMSKHQSNITIAAGKEVEEANDLEKANRYLEVFKTASKRQTENMTMFRDKLAFEEAKTNNTFAAYESFFAKSEITMIRYNRDLLIKAQKKLLESFIAEKGWGLYPSFEEKYKDNIYVQDATAAYELIKIVRKKSLKEYQNFTQAYPHSPFNKFAKDYMFDIIMEGTNLPDYDFFVRAYPKYERSDKIWLKFYHLYLQEHGSNAVDEFAQNYPEYPFQDAIQDDAQKALTERDKPLFEKAKKSEDIIEILNFIENSPSSPFIVDLEEAMYKSIKKNPLFRGSKKFLILYPNSKFYDEVLDALYDQYISDGELITINQFMMEYPEYKNISKLERDLKLAEKGAELGLEKAIEPNNSSKYEEYILVAAPKERAFVALQRLIENDIHDKKWDAALEKVNKVASAFGTDHFKINHLKTLLNSSEKEVPKKTLGEMINSELHEYVPLISMNNKQLYFCRLDKSSTGHEDENIYVSNYKDGAWQQAEYIQGLNTHSNNEGPLGISPDNHHIIIFKGNIQNGDMQIADHNSDGWSKPKSFPNTINTPSWDADGMISSDGKALLYVSERKEVLDLKLEGNLSGFHGSSIGNRDIFVSLKDESGQWQTPINLGDVINTPFAERTPFLHPDMRTLYFSSDGHGGLGNLDVYKTTRLDDSWTNWSTPINLGKAVNTAKNDWGYRISTDGNTAYFSATNDNGNEDIYYITLPKKYRPGSVSSISGHLTDTKGKPIEAEIVWEDIETGKEVGRLKSNHLTGEFFIALPNDKQYSYFVFKEDYFPKSNHIDLRNTQGLINVNEKLELIKIDEMVENGISLPLKNLFFETNKYSIKSTSYLELNRLIQLIKKYNLQVNISGHTDNTGNHKENISLSQNRADAIRDYLIKQGCKASKIETKGHGSAKPIADNKTEEGRKLNRRVEVRFYK